MLARLAKANPGVNIGHVRAGESLVYPGIEAKAPPVGAYLVKVGAVDSLEKGFAFISRVKDRENLSLSLFCTSHPETGTRFDVVVAALYPDQARAQTALAALPGCAPDVSGGSGPGTVTVASTGAAAPAHEMTPAQARADTGEIYDNGCYGLRAATALFYCPG